MYRKVFIPIPRTATHAILWMRNSLPAKEHEGARNLRTLSDEGQKLARGTRYEYETIVNRILGTRFGEPSLYCAPDGVSMMTATTIFPRCAVKPDTRIGRVFDLRRIDNGEWYKKLHDDEGMTFQELIDEAYVNEEGKTPELDEFIDEFNSFLLDRSALANERFRIAVGPETMISMLARHYGEHSENVALGLFSCQAMIFFIREFLDKEGSRTYQVVGICRHNPAKTLERLFEQPEQFQRPDRKVVNG